MSPHPPHAIPITLGHSPDPDDAFMWYPLADFAADDPQAPGGRAWSPRVPTGSYRFRHVLEDIQSLNQRSQSDDPARMLDITALSIHQYPYIADRYVLTTCGASMGDGYGPMVVVPADSKLEAADLSNVRIAVPGLRTSAFLALSLLMGRRVPSCEVVMFDQILGRVADGSFEAGLIIHEGQLTFANNRLRCLIDLGQWWKQTRGLPLPLGGNAIRRDLARLVDERSGRGGLGPSDPAAGSAEDPLLREVCSILLASIRYALAHRQEAVAYALNYARDMHADLADRFVGMYVNDWTIDYGPRGRQAIQRFLGEAAAMGLVPEVGEVDFVAPA